MSMFWCSECSDLCNSDEGAEEIRGKLVCAECIADSTDDSSPTDGAAPEIEAEARHWIKQCEGIEDRLTMRERKLLRFARAILSSPRVEEVRREALEEAAKVAEALAAELARLKGSSDRRVQIGSHLETCATIAADIRALSLQVE